MRPGELMLSRAQGEQVGDPGQGDGDGVHVEADDMGGDLLDGGVDVDAGGLGGVEVVADRVEQEGA